MIAAPAACPCCGGRLCKLGEDITETLEVIPRQWKVIQTVRERFSCRSCETITQPPAPFHPIARGRAGPQLLAMINPYAVGICIRSAWIRWNFLVMSEESSSAHWLRLAKKSRMAALKSAKLE